MKIAKPPLKFSDSKTNPTGYFPVLKHFRSPLSPLELNIKGGSCLGTFEYILQSQNNNF